MDQTVDDVNVTNNWWGTTNESAIANSFYDYYTDFNLGKVNFVPYLTEPNPDTPAKSTPIPTPPPLIPDFSSWILLPILMIATLLISMVFLKKRKH